ncbi:hypothetical protein FisN_11Lh287 [Fistulifera solaris]|uniref:PABS domain-containing protein n=1 Tax=Fistulifera solaris TaxID=1519565 RepID=A0A1Z5K1E4_FISSO|nr:hypothetical protein FisN_11Lh287 [Fistulifera solaris]|eukprot:GAX19841.1 hypothetical protein FisN_11Lh287 [Fistulifera solaris]
MVAHDRKKSKQNDAPSSHFHVDITLVLFWGSIILASLVAFGIGYFSRIYLFIQSSPKVNILPASHVVRSETLPPPLLDKCKVLPQFVYTSKHYETGIRTTSDNMLVRHQAGSEDVEACPSPDTQQGDDEEEHQPAGQHMLVDIKNVDGSFLNSELRLANAMVELVRLSGLTMLSYHCHGLDPVGVSCIGVLLESHVSFHTWPIEGVITFDLFTCGPKSLIPYLDTIKELFGVPRQFALTGGSTADQPHMNWSYKKRGFKRGSKSNADETTDMNMFLLGWMEYDMKQIVADVQTDFQTIEIYDVLNPRFRDLDSYKRSLVNDGSYEATHPEFFKPDRIVYMDHIMQSRLFGEAAYHEALVHPALFAHVDPKRVAIIGGGEGATLREVLKHNTIQRVTMIEIDEQMVQTSRQYLPEWSDCSNLEGSADSCFDDPRAEVFYTDAVQWFMNHYGEGSTNEKYDVIIMDALDPSSEVEFSDVLYNNDKLAAALSRALGDDGIIISQVGEDDFLNDAGSHISKKKSEQKFMKLLKNNGFTAVKEYSEAHGNFHGVWHYVILFKDRKSLANWYSNEAEINLKMRHRSMKVKNASSTPFRFFDGATMMGYQFATRINEEVACRGMPRPAFCEMQHGFDPNRENTPASTLEVKPSLLLNGEQGLFSKQVIPEGSYVAIEEKVNAILLPPSTTRIIEALQSQSSSLQPLAAYLSEYGQGHNFYGMYGMSVDPSRMHFLNYGCYTSGIAADATEIESSFYNPFIDRSHLLLLRGTETVTRDVQEGEELLGNFLSVLLDKNTKSRSYRAQCLVETPVA